MQFPRIESIFNFKHYLFLNLGPAQVILSSKDKFFEKKSQSYTVNFGFFFSLFHESHFLAFIITSYVFLILGST